MLTEKKRVIPNEEGFFGRILGIYRGYLTKKIESLTAMGLLSIKTQQSEATNKAILKNIAFSLS
ncbi:hypothetical protein [Proteus penneri]|uniref:hypothetical protein n=1 Tax=Proteus penneri TaxID=102862 RepID=UPI0034D3FCBB